MSSTEQLSEILEKIIKRVFPLHDPSSWKETSVGPLTTGTGVEERIIDDKLVGNAKSCSLDKAPCPGLKNSYCRSTVIRFQGQERVGVGSGLITESVSKPANV